jgi:hypothetical protein
MKNKALLLALPLVITLQGCVSTGVNGENVIGNPGSPAWFGTASRATINAHYKETCLGYGFLNGTTAMAQCIQSESKTTKQGADNRLQNFIESTKPKSTYNTNCTSWGRNINCTTR